jgi:peptidoglycan/LPS O-acetylase OafA/YrhL
VLAAALVALSLAFRWTLYPQPELYFAIATLPAFAAHFVFGLTAARIRGPGKAFRAGAAILAGSLLIGVLAWQFTFDSYAQAWETRLSNVVARPLLALAFAALLVAIRDEAGLLNRALSLEWLHGWGERSYSLYLTHVPVLLLFARIPDLGRVPFWLFAALSAAACLCFALLFHRLVEQPTLRLRRWMRERADQPAP